MSQEKNVFESPSVESDSIEILSLKLLKTTDELVKANNELASKNEALYKSEKARKEMLSNISHDLRAPITAIRSSIDLLSDIPFGKLSEEDLHSSLGLIDRRVKNLESLIQDMYYLFCVEDEGRKLELEVIEAAPFLENYFFDATIDSRYDSHEMIIDVPMDLNCKILIDVQKTVRVLDNLFTNAAKYSGEGSNITLSAGVDKSDDEERLIISVMDDGVGIPAEAVDKIFDRTYTASTSRTPGQEAGSGLGLSIVKAVVERENGTIKCISSLGLGCNFVISLPIYHDKV